MPILQTPLCRLLNVEVPIVAAPMGAASTPALVAAVSNAGGLGQLGFSSADVDTVRRRISETQELTDRPFGANFILRGIEETSPRLEACLEASVPVISFHWNEPFEYVERIHSAGSLVMYTVATAKQARRADDAGVDIIVAQGWEAGGHVRGEVATMALLPRVVDAVSPTLVISAGGIADGRGMAAALLLGASGVWLGTRFLASEEAGIVPSWQERILSADESDTLLSPLFNIGWADAPGRAIRNSTIERWEAAGRPPPGQRPGEGDVLATRADGRTLTRYTSMGAYPGTTGDIEALPNWAGQSVGLVTRIQPAGQIVEELAEEAVRVLKSGASLIQTE